MRGTRALILLVFGMTACTSTPKSDREPAGAENGRIRLHSDGESCGLNLNGDKESDTVEIGTIGGKRVVALIHAGSVSRFHVEELSAKQFVDCVINQEPGAPIQGTDESEKAARASVLTDYVRIQTGSAATKVMYFDPPSNGYKAIFQED